MIRRFLITVMLITLSIPAIAKDDRGIAIRPVAPTGGEAKGDLWLLAIGIDSYLSWPRLKTATNDAKAVRDTLLSRYHLDKSHVIELLDDKATRKNILAAFRDLAKKVKPEDSLLVFYAGHGHIDQITGKGSWIPVESSTDDPSSWIDNRNITDYLNINAIKAKHVLLVSDSCFSGDFFRGNRGTNTPTIDDAFLKKAYNRSSRQAISSGGLEPVSDAGFGGNSVFSHFLVAALQSNSKSYLIPSEIFGEIKSGVGRNADQLPQYGDLHGVGGQDGGELILFLKQENRLQEMGATSAARQKELEQLRKMEQDAAVAKQKEQAEIAKREQELATLDKQIADMKGRLGAGAARSGDSLDNIIALAEQKEAQGNRLEELRKQREAEEQKRQQEIEQLKKEAAVKRVSQIKADLAKYQKVASSKYAQDMKGSAWEALIATYPEAKGISRYDEAAFLAAFGLAIDNGEFIPLVEKQRRDAERRQAREAAERGLAGEFVTVPGGCFTANNRQTCVDGFRIGKYEVTQVQWRKVMGSNPSHFKQCGDDCPVEQVSWDDAQSFISRLNSQTGMSYRLPTEAEWEYACRSGGRNEEYCGGDNIDAVAWYNGNSGNRTHPVGQLQANGLGIYDMSGNVCEWVSGAAGASSGSTRLWRGGSWISPDEHARAAFSNGSGGGHRGYGLGFRLAAPVQ
jgi:formylglycine-generating enzyme required for sulfatase activity